MTDSEHAAVLRRMLGPAWLADREQALALERAIELLERGQATVVFETSDRLFVTDDNETAVEFIGDNTFAKVFVQIHDVTGLRESETLVPREVADEIYRLVTSGVMRDIGTTGV